MEVDEHYERFDMDNDFEGGKWIGDEFFYTNKKRKRQQTKDEQLYGYDSDLSDSERPRRGRGEKKQTDYSQPVGFVSSGVVRSTDEKPEDVEQAEHSAGGLGLGSKARPSQNGGGLGLGAAGVGAAGGLGFMAALDPNAMGLDDDEDDNVVMPTSFGKSVKQEADRRRKEQKAKQKAQKKASAAVQPGGDVGVFEKHTKGIGAKLLASMGYKPGEGLGRNRQGINKPIEAKLRPQRMGMGFNDYEEHKLLKPEDQVKAEKAPEQAKEQAVDVRLWKKKHAQARVRREYRTADEVLAEAAERPQAAPKQTIIDMRGPQTRLVTNLEHLNMAEDGQEGGDPGPMPELQHNLRLLVDLAEADIHRIDGKLRQEKDTAVILGREQVRLQEELEQVRRQVSQVAHVMQEVAKCQTTDAHLSLGEVCVTYTRLKKQCREEYIMYNLAAAALSQVLPRFSVLLADWQPLQHPQNADMLGTFAAWRPLLESDAQRDNIFQDLSPSASDDPYTRLLAATVLPRLSTAVANAWEPREPESLLQFLEAWAHLLPPTVQRHILDTLVFPKVSRAVQAWEPREERIPLHAWLHPWLELLGRQLEDLYPTIRFKLASALQSWHPSDGSALALLSPWHTVFEPKEWASLTGRSILPKLAYCLDHEFTVNPVDQKLESWEWAMAWSAVLPRQQLISLLEDHFFPKWRAVLQHWLAHNPDYDEVTAWYLGWKGMLPPEAQDTERVRAQLTWALNAMNSAMEGVPLQYAQPAPSPAVGAGYAYAGAAGVAQATAGVREVPAAAAGAAEPSLRDLVESYAQEAGMEFLPKARQHEGLQVYGFGGVSCVVDNAAGVLRAHIGGQWVLTSLEQLLAEARRRQRL